MEAMPGTFTDLSSALSSPKTLNLCGDAFTHYTTPEEYMREYESMPMAFSINGIWASDVNIRYMRAKGAEGFNFDENNVFAVHNHSFQETYAPEVY